jgi:hypothetical protein
VVWKNSHEKEFMATYGDAVLKQYNLPTEEELEQLKHYKDEDNKEDNKEEDNDKDDNKDDNNNDLE